MEGNQCKARILTQGLVDSKFTPLALKISETSKVFLKIFKLLDPTCRRFLFSKPRVQPQDFTLRDLLPRLDFQFEVNTKGFYYKTI